MLERPILKPQYRALLVESQGVALLSHTAEHLLPARLYEQLLPLLDGTSTEELVDHFRGQWEPTDIWCALWHLERRGCVAEGHEDNGRCPETEPTVAAEKPGIRMALTLLGETAAHAWGPALQGAGFILDEAAPLSIVLTDSYLRPELADINDRELRTGHPWLLVKPAGPVIWVGPVFRPGDGGCWKCLEARLRRNRPLEYHLLRGAFPARRLDPPPGTAGARDSGASLAHELSRLLQCLATDEPTDSVIIVDTTSGSRSRHRVLRRPQCPACGDSGLYAQRVAGPFRLQPQLKRSTEGGACRVTAATETLIRYRGLLDPLVGVVLDMHRLDGGAEAPSHVYRTHYGREPVPCYATLAACMLSGSSGKGRNEVEAKTSSLGEAIERYSACFQGDEPRVSASLEELGPAAVHPNLCMQVSEAQYQGRQEWNRRCVSWEQLPAPLEATRRLDWTPVWPLSGEAPRYLPTMLLYSGYPAEPRDACCLFDPSGGAAGNTPEEAVLQGLLELVERDSLALWWYNRVPRPAVDLAGIRDQYCRSLISHHQGRGRELWVLDLTSDLAIPAFAAVSRRIGPGPEHIVFGFGAHLDPHVAISRAVAEMDQLLTGLTAQEREGSLDATVRDWLRHATVMDHPYLAPGPFSPTRPHDLTNLATSDIVDDIRVCERVLASHDLEVLILDQTRPDIGVPVMKVIVPGLRHFRRRLAPGRLYTAPVAAGWLRRSRLETELNPIGLFL